MCGWHVLTVTGVLDLNIEANVTRNLLEQLQRGREGEKERERERQTDRQRERENCDLRKWEISTHSQTRRHTLRKQILLYRYTVHYIINSCTIVTCQAHAACVYT